MELKGGGMRLSSPFAWLRLGLYYVEQWSPRRYHILYYIRPQVPSCCSSPTGLVWFQLTSSQGFGYWSSTYLLSFWPHIGQAPWSCSKNVDPTLWGCWDKPEAHGAIHALHPPAVGAARAAEGMGENTRIVGRRFTVWATRNQEFLTNKLESTDQLEVLYSRQYAVLCCWTSLSAIQNLLFSGFLSRKESYKWCHLPCCSSSVYSRSLLLSFLST